MRESEEQALAGRLIDGSSTPTTPPVTPEAPPESWLGVPIPAVRFDPSDALLEVSTGLTGKHLAALRAATANAAANQLKAYAKQGKTWNLAEWESIPNRPSAGTYGGFIEIIPKSYENPRITITGVFSPPEYTAYLHTLRLFHAGLYGRLKPFRGPVEVEVDFFMPKPVKKCRAATYADTRPDLDNMAKAFIDSLDFLAGAENRQRARARKKQRELQTYTGAAPSDRFPKIQYGSVLTNDSKVVRLVCSKQFDTLSPTFKPGIRFLITPLYDQTPTPAEAVEAKQGGGLDDLLEAL